MGRRSSRPAGGRRSASRPPSRAASSRAAPPRRTPAQPPARAAPKAAAPAPQKKSAAPAPATGTAPAKQPSAMGGFMANVASTGLGVMAGRALDRTFFGGGSQAPAEDVPPEDAAPQAYDNEFAPPSEEISPSVCAREALEFKKCMERSGSDVASCQWNLDVLAACQQQQPQTGFADAGRF